MSLGVCALAFIATVPTQLEGQARRTNNQNLKRLLIIPPRPESPQDSALSIEFANQFRDKASGKLRNQMRVFDTDTYCEALAASGFECGTLLDDNSAEQLASFMTADAYIIGRISSGGGTPKATIRLIDARRSGMSGRVEIPGQSGIDARGLAEQAADSVRNQVRAAEQVVECGERRDRGDLRAARDRADRAFELYPNHPSAALCVAYLFEAASEPVDSLIWAYRKVVAGDPADSRGWERLGRLFFQQGDTVSAIEAFGGQLEVDRRNNDLRINIAGMWAEVDSMDRALAALEGGVEYDAERFLQRMVFHCVEAEMWGCVLDVSERRFSANDALGSDRDFIQSVIGAAQLGADTTAALRWTGIAAQRFSDDTGGLLNHAGWLKGAGYTDSALAIFTRVAGMDPSNTTALLAIVSTMQDGFVIDSTTPVDSMALHAMDSLLTLAAAAAAGDPQTLAQVGSLYLRPGIGYAQLRIHQRLAADWLARSLEFPLPQSVVGQANFFLGFMTVFYLTDIFAEVQAAETCEAVDMYETHVMRGKNSLILGQSIAPGAAQQILDGQYTRYEAVIPQFREAWQCAAPSGGR